MGFALVRRLAHIARRLYELLLLGLAVLWRTLLVRTTVIAVTGSVGKTAAKDYLSAMLAAQAPTVSTIGNRNAGSGMARVLLGARPWRHRYVVIEIGSAVRGGMVRGSFVIRPDVVVLLAVAPTHTTEFRSLEETAREKAALMRFMNRSGIVVLNGDDPRVAAMTTPPGCRIVTFGSSENHDIRVTGAVSQWPDRLAFRATLAGETWDVRTRAVGAHWAPAVAGALATAWAVGADVGMAFRAVQAVEPFLGRMQPVDLPNGAVMLRDEALGDVHSAEAALEVLREAKAQRRLLVLSDCSDFPQHYRHRHRHLARLAAESCDAAVYVGEKAGNLAKQTIRAGMPAESVRSFLTLEETAGYLKAEIRAGDLVLLKGRVTDHLTRLYFAQIGPVKCWKGYCPLHRVCDSCKMLGASPPTN